MKQGEENMQKYFVEFFFSTKSLEVLGKTELSVMYGLDPARLFT